MVMVMSRLPQDQTAFVCMIHEQTGQHTLELNWESQLEIVNVDRVELSHIDFPKAEAKVCAYWGGAAGRDAGKFQIMI